MAKRVTPQPQTQQRSASLTRLTAQPSGRFIGRKREQTQLKRLLKQSRLLTLMGAGGCGKTRLALALAHRNDSSRYYEDGIFIAELAALDDPALVAQAVALALGVRLSPNRSALESLLDYLRPKQLLLVLDNCEHLLVACAELADILLRECPQLRLLVTSRTALNLPNETVWLVPSLSLPDPAQPPSLERLRASEAAQLFVARAQNVLPDFALTAYNAPSVLRICQRLDGIPLALELAAARVKLLDVSQIAARLDDTLGLLTRGNRWATPRHQTMRAALDWSYDLLSASEQTLFRRLSVFAGGFTLEAAESVCSNQRSVGSSQNSVDRSQMNLTTGSWLLTAHGMLDVLSALVEQSLVLVAERTPGEAVRYRLLEPIRQYAREKLREAGEEASTRNRQLAFFLAFAEQVEPKIRSSEQRLWLKRLDDEHDNLRAALDWSLTDAQHAEAGLRLATALHLYWQRRSLWSEGRRWLQQAIAHFGDPAANLHLARALVALTWLAVYQSDYGDTRAPVERGLAFARTLNDQPTVARALGLLSLLSAYASDQAAARQFADECVVVARQSGDQWTLAWAMHILGHRLSRTPDVKATRALLEESLSLFRVTGDKRSIAVPLVTLGIVAATQDELDMARELYAEALTIGQELSDAELQAKVTANLAIIEQLRGDVTHAEELFSQALAQARDMGLKATRASCLRGLGQIRLSQDRVDEAAALLRESLLTSQEIRNTLSCAMSLAGLGRVMAARGHVHVAARVLGAVQAWLAANPRMLDPEDRMELERLNGAARARMTRTEFETAYAAGSALTLEQAITEIMVEALRRNVSPRPRSSATRQRNVSTTLRIAALGVARVARGDQPITAWSYAKVKELLFYLVSYPARTKAQIGLALWPEASPAQLRNNLGMALYHLRRALGNSQWVIFANDQYRFNRKLDYWCDVELFEAKLQEAIRLQDPMPQAAIALWQEAIALYQGEFVEDLLEGDWFLLRREELRHKYLDALLELGRLWSAQGAHDHAAEAYRRALEKDDLLEEAHRELMRCYARLGERGLALRQYQTLAQRLRVELASMPAPPTLALYEKIQRGEDV
jgi:predicted ATPase/DNA-binding SARP family transcriptional activator